jgi:NTP pyrophosphatase (non-canonical NTP hydrolase)
VKKLQVEHAEWLAIKYPNQSPSIPAMGCLEEAGELVHAILKTEQLRIWNTDTRYNVVDLRAKLVDAIGDCGIFACSLCTANGWNFEEVCGYVELMDPGLSFPIVRLVRAACTVVDRPTDIHALINYLSELYTLAHNSGLDVDAAIRITWEKVKCR